jgi:predicted Rossmann-fold nucleotide-binding protein
MMQIACATGSKSKRTLQLSWPWPPPDGRIASERGGALRPRGDIRDNVIATGGGPGIMEAANRGASEARAPSIGFNIGLPHEQEPNAYSTPELSYQFHYFAVRKLHFAMRANALVVFPGAFGTIDELFELLTLMQNANRHPHRSRRESLLESRRQF